VLLSSPCLHKSKKGLGVAESGAIVQHELAEVSRAIVLSNLTELVRGLEVIRNDLQEIHVTTRSLQDNSNSLARSK
jgi:prominin 1